MPRIYPHEFFFGGYLLITWMRLVGAPTPLGADALVYAAGIALAAALALWDLRTGTPGSLRWRLLFYPVAMNVFFQQMRSAIPMIAPEMADAKLRAIDAALLGDTPALLMQGWVSPWATEALSLCYLLFFPYLLLSLIRQFIGPLERCRAFVAGLFSLYGIGFLGYTLVPAAGPYLALGHEFAVPLAGGPLTAWNDALVRMGSTGVDVFPSLHVAVSTFLLGFDYRHQRRRFWFYLLPCAGLWLSTLYLRYHYLIDVVCGFALAGFALWIAHRWTPAPETRA